MPLPEAVRIEVRPAARKGRGVFARTRFAAGELIESAPVIVLPAESSALLERTVLRDLPYNWGDGEALVMGLGSFYNHSYTPNARYERNHGTQSIEYLALREIAAGEEITVNYNGVPDDRSPLWFDVAAAD